MMERIVKAITESWTAADTFLLIIALLIFVFINLRIDGLPK